MARWKLMSSHYLNVPDEEWEYKETDRKTGREKRIRLPVPRLLDINDPSCFTTRLGGDTQAGTAEGEIVVCHEDKGSPGDITFFGDPTPEMVPLDDEAKAITAKFEKQWKYKPEEATAGHSQSLIDQFQIEMAEVRTKPAEIPGLAELTAAMLKQTEMVGKLLTERRI